MRGRWTKNALLLMALTLPVTALPAQQMKQPAAEPAAQTAQAADLSANRPQLSPEQKKQMRDLRLTARDQAAIILHDPALSPEQKQYKLHELRRTTREKMQAVLTPEQQAQMKQMRAARRHRIADKLGLSADQRTKLKELAKSTRQQRRSVLNDSSLSNDQKMAQLAQIRESAKSQLATILTPDQLAQMQQMRRHRRHRVGMHR
jgi:Spy/CpxP family protein refolding chaperone